MTTTHSVAETIALKRRLPAPAGRRALRQAAGIRAAQIASDIGVTRQAVSNWERGEREPRGLLLRAYVEILDLLRESQP